MEGRNEVGHFSEGNRLWELRDRSGPLPIFETADELWAAAVAYFEWVEENPLYERKAFHNRGAVVTTDLPKMRAMTLDGLFLHIGVAKSTWHSWKTHTNRKFREDLIETMDLIETVIREQKFTGAAADLLNPVIIARDLGLADKTELSGPDGKPVQTINKTMSPQEAAEAYAGTLTDSSDQG